MRKLLWLWFLLTAVAWGQYIPTVPATSTSGGGGSPTFTHTGGTTINGSGTTKNIVLGAAPSTGDVVACALLTNVAVSAPAAHDSNSNNYIFSTHSPATFLSGAGQLWLFYLASAPSNATATITVSWTTTSSDIQIWCDDFGVSGGTAAFYTDVVASPGSSGTTINTPSITPSASGNLLYACGSPTGTVSAPAAGGTLGGWTGAAGGIADSAQCEYQLSSGSGATAVDFTMSSSTGWVSGAMAFN